MRHFGGKTFWFFLALAAAVACKQRAAADRLSEVEKSRLARAVAAADSLTSADRLAASDSLLKTVEPLAEKAGRSREGYLFHRRRVLNRFEKTPTAAASEARELVARFAAPDDSISGFYCSLLGWAEWQNGAYLAGIPALERAASLYEKHGPAAKLNGVYNNLGICYGQLGDHEKAVQNYEAALRLNLKTGDSTEVSANHFNLAKAWLNLGDFQKAAENARAARDFSTVDDGSFDFQMSEIELARGQKEEALRRLRRLETERPELFNPDENDDADDNLLAAGEAELAAGQPAAAIFFLKKSLPLLLETADSSSWEVVKTRFLLGDAFLKTGDERTALGWFEQSIGAATGGFRPAVLGENPPAAAFPPEVWAMEALNGKAQSLAAIFEKTRRPSDLSAALDTWERAGDLLQKLDAHFTEDGSRVALGEQTIRAFFERPIDLSLRLAEITGEAKWRERAFLFASRSKAAVLKTALSERRQLRAANLSPEQTRRFYELRMAAAALESHLSKEPTDSSRAAFFTAKRAFDSFKNSLRLPPPEASPTGQTLRLDSLQAALPTGSLLVEYFLGEGSLFVFSVSKTGLLVEKKPISPQFEAEAETFRRSVSDWKWVAEAPREAEAGYLRSAGWLFDFLLKKHIEAQPEARRLFVVPDGILARLPFAALLTRPFSGGWKETGLPVLIKEKAVSYLFSSSFLLEKKEPTGGEKRISFGGFGSDYRDRFTLAALRKEPGQEGREFLLAMRGGPDTLDHADDEVDSIAAITGGEKWVNERATKANFLENAGRCAILHTSLHTLDAPSRDPTGLSILFSKTSETDPNLLTSNELYALDLRADLTVVSTCESGFGELRKGEGAMSLGRAVALAGCPATVVNLWKADDLASKNLMIAFYKNLKSGQPKDVALQNAMLSYLEKTVSEKSPPLYWANFSAFGEMRPVDFPAASWRLAGWGIGLAALLFGGILLFLKRRSR